MKALEILKQAAEKVLGPRLIEGVWEDMDILEKKFKDLVYTHELDSLSWVELLVAIEEIAGIHLPDEEVGEIKTVKELVSIIEQKLRG